MSNISQFCQKATATAQVEKVALSSWLHEQLVTLAIEQRRQFKSYNLN